MAHVYRFNIVQVVTLFVVSALIGASAATMAGRSGVERAEAATFVQSGSSKENTREKKRMGRPVVHFEIGCRDNAKTRDFYAKMFDWQMTAAGPASMIQTEAGKGIDGHITSLGHEPHNYVTFYIEVEDIQSHLDKAATLGGKTVVPPVNIPTGKFAWFSDPEGNIIGLLQPKKP
jgi:predicted enzyme related to lactoylglutathione lyase